MRITSQRWTIACLGSGAMALVNLLLAFCTTQWLNLTENCAHVWEGENETVVFNYTLKSNAGLWKLCTRSIPDPMNSIICVDTGLSMGLKKERNQGQFMTGSVTEATRIQFPLTCLAVVLTLSGFVCSILGNFKKDKKTIYSAVCYILSGLCLSVGVILYISSINDELSFQQSKDCYAFKYEYGWSFYLVGISFMMEESSAVISIKLYLERNFHNLDMMLDILPGLEDKINKQTARLKRTDSQSQTLIW